MSLEIPNSPSGESQRDAAGRQNGGPLRQDGGGFSGRCAVPRIQGDMISATLWGPPVTLW